MVISQFVNIYLLIHLRRLVDNATCKDRTRSRLDKMRGSFVGLRCRPKVNLVSSVMALYNIFYIPDLRETPQLHHTATGAHRRHTADVGDKNTYITSNATRFCFVSPDHPLVAADYTGMIHCFHRPLFPARITTWLPKSLFFVFRQATTMHLHFFEGG